MGMNNVPGPGAIQRSYRRHWTAFPDAVFVIEDVSETSSQVAIRWTITDTNLGPLDGHPASGNQVALHGLALFTFEQDRIDSSWIEYDRLGLHEQIAPAAPLAICPHCRELP
jgi:predicted ester cyclase